MAKKEMFQTGDAPGIGTYRCTVCGLNQILENDTDALKPCSMCGDVTWAKLKQSS